LSILNGLSPIFCPASRQSSRRASAHRRTRLLRSSIRSTGDQRGPRRSKIKSQLEGLGLRARSSSPADYGKLIAEDTEKWAKAVKFSCAKAN